MLSLLDKGPALPGLDKMREELERCIVGAEKEVWSAQPDQIKLECTTTALSNLRKEEGDCVAQVAKLEQQLLTVRTRLGKVQKDISDNEEAMVFIQSAMADAGGEQDDSMDYDDGYYGWYGWTSWRKPWQGGYEDKEDTDESYLEQLKKLYRRLDQESSPESLAQAAVLTHQFAEAVSDRMVAAAPRPLAHPGQSSLQQPQGAMAPATPPPLQQQVPLSPSAALTPKQAPVLTSGTIGAIAVGAAAGRKVRANGKPEHKGKKAKSVAVTASGDEGDEDSGEDLADAGVQSAAVGAALGAQALGFPPAGGTSEVL
jgi:hypothetical protein